MFKRLLKIVSIIVCILMSIGFLYQYVGEKLDQYKFPPIGKLIDVGGYRLHMLDSSYFKTSADMVGILQEDQPTIILESGLGGNCLSFSLVQSKIAKFARVISYDRAGHGWSDASPLPRTAENIVQDLHTMLHNADIKPPYILVGHSFGGIIVRLFASHFSDEVTGVILLDASHETIFDDKINSMNSTSYRLQQWYEKCRWYFDHYLGIERFETEWNTYKHSNDKDIANVDFKNSMYNGLRLPETDHTYIKNQLLVALRLTNKVMHTKISESDNFPLSCQQVKDSYNGLENKPLIVISAGKARSSAKSTQKWAALQADLVTKSKFGKQMIAQHSGHDIMTDQPEIVVKAVRAMIDELHVNKEI